MPRAKSDEKENQKAILRTWLESVRDSTGLSWEQIGKRAQLDPSNLTRFIKPDSKTSIGLETIRKISKVFGIPAPVQLGLEPRFTGFGEHELVHWKPEAADRMPLSNNTDWWEVRTNLLELQGFMVGDKIAVDLNRKVHDGDIVVAQAEHGPNGEVETILRKYEMPFLVCRTANHNYPKPEIVDGRRIIIMGVVTLLRREVAASAA
tara:strand:- start:251 stop:868 length:618 start_codon:yes stop_codon:yes gene_type:complete